MLEKLKALWAQWKIQISIAGGVIVVASAYGQCTYEPAVAEEAPAAEEVSEAGTEESSETTTTAELNTQPATTEATNSTEDINSDETPAIQEVNSSTNQ
ncbi:hypothetical protein OAA09_00625 [bacterium]|nr:hypothetical protein [bacterium]